MTRIRCLAVAVGAAALIAGCSSTHRTADPGAAPTSTTVAIAARSRIARVTGASPELAVAALLKAEQQLDHRTSFAFLSSAGVDSYPTPQVWARRRTDSAKVTGFHRESVKGPDITMLVEHKAAIDAFVGLQFAREHQIWHTRQESGGWLVDPDPTVDPVVPPDASSITAAAAWTAAQQSCDGAAAAKLQAVVTPFGISAGVAGLCHAPGKATVSAPTIARPGPQTADLVAQYGPSVLPFVRKVGVSGLAKPFSLLLVPIGESWLVIAVGDG